MYINENEEAMARASKRLRWAEGETKKPFKVEEFCAQLAWMGKRCPVYPWGGNENPPCIYLLEEDYEGYICLSFPGAPTQLARVVMEKGTKEQKKSVEYLADVFLKYGSIDGNSMKMFKIYIEQIHLLWEAGNVYKELGLKRKLSETNQAIEKAGGEEVSYGLIE